MEAVNGGGTLYSDAAEDYSRQLSSINEADDNKGGNQLNNSAAEPDATAEPISEITTVALEVIAAHLSHLKQLEAAVSKEKELLADLEKLSDASLSNNDQSSSEVRTCLGSLSEEYVCDYFESLHICVDSQQISSDKFLREMERICQGEENGHDISHDFRDVAQSPDLST